MAHMYSLVVGGHLPGQVTILDEEARSILAIHKITREGKHYETPIFRSIEEARIVLDALNAPRPDPEYPDLHVGNEA